MKRISFPMFINNHNSTAIMICSMAHDRDDEEECKMVFDAIAKDKDKWVFFADIMEVFHKNAIQMLADQRGLPYMHPLVVRAKKWTEMIFDWSDLDHKDVFAPDLVKLHKQN